MSTKSFLEKYRWEGVQTYDEYGNLHFSRFQIIAPKNSPIAEAYSADDAQKIVDALNRVPVVGPVEEAVEAERERCARIAEDRHEYWRMPHPDDAKPGEVCCDVTACADIATAIRAGGKST